MRCEQDTPRSVFCRISVQPCCQRVSREHGIMSAPDYLSSLTQVACCRQVCWCGLLCLTLHCITHVCFILVNRLEMLQRTNLAQASSTAVDLTQSLSCCIVPKTSLTRQVHILCVAALGRVVPEILYSFRCCCRAIAL